MISMTSTYILYALGAVLILISLQVGFRGGSFFEKIKGIFSQSSSAGAGASGLYLSDISKLVEEGKIDPVIGREEEIRRLTQILSRRRKNNVILVGDPGVGKTAIAEGLALKIAEGTVPDVLQGKRIETLNVSEILGGTKYRGEFEQRVRGLVDHIRQSNRGIILFIDEIHTIMQTKGTEGAVNLADILKPSLARGELQLIGATTLKEYKQYIEPDDSLERRFQPLMVDEPSIEESIAILKGLKTKYEEYHHVTFTDDAIESAVRLSKEYITERKLPDKAIDVMDEAGAMIHVYADVPAVPEHAGGVLYGAAHHALGGLDKQTQKKKQSIAQLHRKIKRLTDEKKIVATKQ
jgi:ATP-dependent Clp protease ATP-binding subunit ClpA